MWVGEKKKKKSEDFWKSLKDFESEVWKMC